jgi:hypothetical protein
VEGRGEISRGEKERELKSVESGKEFGGCSRKYVGVGSNSVIMAENERSICV